MNSVLFTHPLWSRLAATHLHFLWQGLLIAWLYWTVIKVFAVQSARVRYALGMTGLLAMAVCTLATFLLVEVPASNGQMAQTISSPDQPEEHRLSSEIDLSLSTEETEDTSAGAVNRTLTNPKPIVPGKQRNAADSPGWFTLGLVGAWLLGVVLLGVRLIGGVGTVVWCRWTTLPLTDSQCLRLVERLSRQVGLARCPRLALSLQAKDAFSLGLWRPLIVFPASWLLELSPQTLESVLAHELAHIRRWDAWATLFQRVLESGLFYHPAVWWLSRQMDREREKCCDLWAVSLTGDRLQYVKALAGIAEIQRATRPAKLSAPIFATGMGGKNMQLLERVRHILGETPRTGAASRLFAGAMVLAIPAALWVGTMMLPVNAADENDALAQAEREGDGERERGERERRDGDRREGERRDGERPPRDGDRPRGEREGARPPRDGDRPPREGDRPPRDGDRPRGEREGDRRPPGPPRFRDGERPRGPFPPGVPGFRRDGEPPREGDRPRGEGFRREGMPPGPQGEMLQLIRDLRQEVEALRREVRALRESRGVPPQGRRDGDREFGGPDRRPPGFRPENRGERPGPAREGERGERREREEAERDRPGRPEGDRGERGEAERDRPARRPEGERREGDRGERREREEEAPARAEGDK